MTDTFIVYRVESTPKTYAFLEPQREYTFSFGAFPVVNTTAISGDGLRFPFVDADLDSEGWIYFTHGFGTTVDISVFMPSTPTPIEVNVDQVSYELNRVGIRLGAEFRPLIGSWSILIEV